MSRGAEKFKERKKRNHICLFTKRVTENILNMKNCWEDQIQVTWVMLLAIPVPVPPENKALCNQCPFSVAFPCHCRWDLQTKTTFSVTPRSPNHRKSTGLLRTRAPGTCLTHVREHSNPTHRELCTGYSWCHCIWCTQGNQSSSHGLQARGW